jgi:hypothetical protein
LAIAAGRRGRSADPEQALARAGYADHLDLLLDPYGCPARAILPPPGEHHLDLAGLHPLLAAPLWSPLDALPAGAS